MKIVVTGATGFIGSALVRRLIARGDTVIALTRSAAHARTRLDPSVQAFDWAPPTVGDWSTAIEGADAIVNLAGEPVEAKRWSEAQKDRIRWSRIHATRAIVDAVSAARTPPRVLVNGSAIGFYGDQGSAELTEQSPSGHDFLATVVVAWEEAARPVEARGVRLALARTGVVLGRGGGALPLYVLPFRFFTGGAVGRPDAWISWVHIDDEVGAILHAIDNDRVAGPFNVTAPKPADRRGSLPLHRQSVASTRVGADDRCRHQAGAGRARRFRYGKPTRYANSARGVELRVSIHGCGTGVAGAVGRHAHGHATPRPSIDYPSVSGYAGSLIVSRV